MPEFDYNAALAYSALEEYAHCIEGTWRVGPDGLVDVEGNVFLGGKCRGLTELPIRFGRVTGYFSCANNKFTSLAGAPRWVGKEFHCNGNPLTTLAGAPEYVGGLLGCDGRVPGLKSYKERLRRARE